MNKPEQAARQALEALEVYGEHAKDCPQYPTYTRPQDYPKCDCGFEEAITALREALAEQAEQEPVLCVECGKPTMHMGNKCYACCQKDTKDLEDALKSWDAAPVRTKDLTDDEIWEIWFKDITLDWDERCRAVIAADREKNRG
jgi:hypothetical protein